MKHYLITGGSGFLGINLIRFLLEKGHKIRSLDKDPFSYPEKNQIEEVIGDIQDKELIEKCMKDIDVVVHCAAALPLYSKDEIFKTDVDGTNNLLEAANKHKDTRFIHISSTAVYGIPDHHPVYENDKLEGVGPYGEAKILAEKACEEYREKGMCMTILRPKTFIGPERLGVFAMLYDWALSGANFPMIGNGKNQYQLLDVEDLCEAIYLSANKENPIVNDTFNVAAKEFQTMKQDYQAILDKAGKGKRIVCLPEKPTIWTLKLLEKLRLSPLYKWVYETASKDSYISIEKAEKKLGYHPKFSNQDALLRNFDWYINNQSNFREHSGISHRVPWKQGALRIAKRAFKLF